MRGMRIQTAFILGAGLGTRLRPLTELCPKPLLEIGGRPIITYAMDHLAAAGIGRFIVNTHHRAKAYDRAFPERRWKGIPIVFRHEPVLLETAGGIKNIEDLLAGDDALVVYNGDILTDLPLERLLAAHETSGAEATLALRSAGPLLNVHIDDRGRVVDMRNLLGNPGVKRCLLAGIYVLEKTFLRRLEAGKIESVVPVFAAMIREKPGSVMGAVIDEGSWTDIGSVEEYERARARHAAAAGGEAGPAGEDPEAFARAALDIEPSEVVSSSPLYRGGSDRTFDRLRWATGKSAILVRYSPARAENGHYAAIAGFLEEIGVAVPRFFKHDPGRALILMEDIGDVSLWSLRDAPWEIRGTLYRKTLENIHRLHVFPPADFPARDVPLAEPFGPDLYLWERNYFRENFLRALCRIDAAEAFDPLLEEELQGLAGGLSANPSCLVHRDFQSRNVMIRADGAPVLIDFQGMRFGSPLYDLGSLLCDPYVRFSDEERLALLQHYYGLSGRRTDWTDFTVSFWRASAQRLMQALGAFGFLSLKKGLGGFAEHAPAGLENLIRAAREAGNLPRLTELALKCRRHLGSKLR